MPAASVTISTEITHARLHSFVWLKTSGGPGPSAAAQVMIKGKDHAARAKQYASLCEGTRSALETLRAVDAASDVVSLAIAPTFGFALAVVEAFERSLR